jgi:hypothetical protein
VRASVVVASFSGEAALRSCLDSLERQHGDAEVIVSAAAQPEEWTRLRPLYAWAEFVPAPATATVFQLRALGLARARGKVAVLLEDHCRVDAGWLEALVGAVEGEGGFAGGPIEAGGDPSLAEFALSLVEYGALMPPVADARAILAVNAAYDRRALDACAAVWTGGFHDNEVHDALRAAGQVARLVPGATVRSHLCWPLSRGLAHLFQGGVRFGAYRRRGWGAAHRAVRLVATPIVPAVMIARLAGRLARRRPRALPRLVLALPFLIGLVASWCAGELVGSVRSTAEAR